MKGRVQVTAISMLVLALSSWPSHGQDAAACDKPALLAYADYLLTSPQATGNFVRDGQSATAAYLKIVYAPESYDTARALIETQQKRPKLPGRLEELSLAHLETAPRREAITNLFAGKDAHQSMELVGDSVLRALFEKDSDWFIDELARLDVQKALAFSPHWRRLTKSLEGFDDATLVNIAKRAEALKLWDLAFAAYAAKTNLVDLVAFLDRAPSDFLRVGGEPPEDLKDLSLDLAIRDATFRFTPIEAAAQPEAVLSILGEYPHFLATQPVSALAGQVPEGEVLLDLINQTGDIQLSLIATGLLADIKASRLDPVDAPDAISIAFVRRLDEFLGKDQRTKLLRTMLAIDRLRKPGTEYFDEAIARHTLSPLLKSDQAFPPQPSETSAKFDWTTWTEVASNLRQGKPISDDDRAIAAQLLAGAQRYTEALDEVRKVAKIGDARALAGELLERLDNRCGDRLRSHAFATEPLFRF